MKKQQPLIFVAINYAIVLTNFVNLETFLATLFLWKIPFEPAISISFVAAINASLAAALSFASTAASTFLTAVLTAYLTDLFLSYFV